MHASALFHRVQHALYANLSTQGGVGDVTLACDFLKGCVASPLDIVGLGEGEEVELLGDKGPNEIVNLHET